MTRVERVKKRVLKGLPSGRDVHIYGGIAALAFGPLVWGGAGVGLAVAGLLLVLIGVFGLPAWTAKEKRNGME